MRAQVLPPCVGAKSKEEEEDGRDSMKIYMGEDEKANKIILGDKIVVYET